MRPYAGRIAGILLIAGWFWWIHAWANDLAVVSPIHWPLLLPQLVLEAVPATIGVVAGGLLFLDSRRARALVLLFCVSAAQSIVLATATPDIARRYEETITRSKHAWRAAESRPPPPGSQTAQ